MMGKELLNTLPYKDDIFSNVSSARKVEALESVGSMAAGMRRDLP